MSNLIYPLNPDSVIFQASGNQLPIWRIPFEVSRRRQRFEFILANIKNIAEPDRIQHPVLDPRLKRIRLNQPFFPPLSHLYCQPTDPLHAVIKVEDPMETNGKNCLEEGSIK
jgi:hypothetical protein